MTHFDFFWIILSFFESKLVPVHRCLFRSAILLFKPYYRSRRCPGTLNAWSPKGIHNKTEVVRASTAWHMCMHTTVQVCRDWLYVATCPSQRTRTYCTGAMLIFFVSFQFERMIPEGNPQQRVGPTIPMLMTTATTIVMVVTTGDNDKLRKGHANLIYTSRFLCVTQARHAEIARGPY